MPNHVHALIGFQNTGKSINKIVCDGKRFIAYEIINRLQAQNKLAILEELNAVVKPNQDYRKTCKLISRRDIEPMLIQNFLRLRLTWFLETPLFNC